MCDNYNILFTPSSRDIEVYSLSFLTLDDSLPGRYIQQSSAPDPPKSPTTIHPPNSFEILAEREKSRAQSGYYTIGIGAAAEYPKYGNTMT